MDNKIMLEFDKTLVALAGNLFGRSIYDSQVKGKVDEKNTIHIEFPPRIRMVASSFVQGFFHDWVEKYGIDGTKELVHVCSENADIIAKIYQNML